MKAYLLFGSFDSSVMNPGNYTHVDCQLKNLRRETPDIADKLVLWKRGHYEHTSHGQLSIYYSIFSGSGYSSHYTGVVLNS